MSIALPPAQGPSAESGGSVDTIAVVQADMKDGGGFWHDVFRRLRRNPTAWFGAIIVLIFLLIAALAPIIAPYPETALPGAKFITPTYIPGPGELPEFPLGLDRFGGDVLSKVDTAIMRVVDIILSVPNLLLAVSIAAILGQTPFAIMIAIGASQVPIFARLLRASMLQQRSSDYVLSAQTLGLGRGRITMSHVLPNAIGPVIVQGTLTLATAVIDAAALSFLGLGGGRPETAEWGRMLTYAQAELAIAPWLAFLPGICIAVTALGFTLLGEALREAMDPRTRAR
jgi:peptide/nickel transport system permease protein